MRYLIGGSEGIVGYLWFILYPTWSFMYIF